MTDNKTGLTLFEQLYAVYAATPTTFEGYALYHDSAADDSYWVYSKKMVELLNASGAAKLTMVSDFDDELTSQDSAIAAILASEIGTMAGVKDSKSIEDALVAYMKPVFAMARGLKTAHVSVFFGTGLEEEKNDEEAYACPGLRYGLEVAQVPVTTLPPRIGWAWSSGVLKRLRLFDDHIANQLIFPPQGAAS